MKFVLIAVGIVAGLYLASSTELLGEYTVYLNWALAGIQLPLWLLLLLVVCSIFASEGNRNALLLLLLAAVITVVLNVPAFSGAVDNIPGLK